MDTKIDKLHITNNGTVKIDYCIIKKCLEDIIKNEAFVKYEIDGKMYSPDGGNYLGVLCEINIKGETNICGKEVNLFLKIITPDQQMTLLSMTDVYKNELFVYGELSNLFTEIQDEIGLTENKRFKMVKYYQESNPNVIIMENMCKKGYKIYSRMECVTLEYAEMAVKELAKFHALSFLIENRRAKYFETKIKSINHAFKLNEEFNGFIKNMCQIAVNNLDNDNRRKFEEYMPNFVEKYVKLVTTKSGRDVLCHGDYRPNNILMYETEGEIEELLPIDYQLMYYGCPLLDFMYLIFLSTDQYFRKKHMTDLKELYYKSLLTFLSYFHLNVEEVYPRAELDKHFKEKLEYGLICSVMIMPFIMAKEDDVPDVTKESLAGLNVSIDDRYKERISGIVSDFIEWGYL